jgi:peptide/nickel transport system substrate-binding protein
VTDRQLPPHSRRAFLAGGASLALLLAGCGGSSSQLPPSDTSAEPPPPDPTTGASAPPATSEAATTATAPATTAADATTGMQTAPGTTAAEAAGTVPGPVATGGTPGGRIVIGYLNEGNSWDPAIGYTETSWDAICNLTFAPLYSYDEQQAPQPNAAAELPQVSADGLVYTIPLREGVMFHHGRPVTAADYVYAFDRTLDPKVESWAASYLYSVDGAKERYEGGAASVRGVRAVDDLTLEVTLATPDVTFLYALTQPFTAPVPQEEVERLGDAWGTTAAVGNGPYRMTGYDATAQTATFARHEAHFWPGLPYVDELEMQWGLDATVQLLKLQRGEVDVLYSGFTPDQVQRVTANEQLQRFMFQAPLFANRWVNLNPTKVPAFADPRVRQAMNLAVDRTQLGRITGQEATDWGAPFPQTFLGDARTFQPLGTDLDRARELIAQAGAEGLKAELCITESPEPQLGQVLQQQWKAVGLDIGLKQISIDASYELALEGELDMWFSGFYAVYPTPLDLISQYYETGGSSNYTKYSNPDVDRLTAEARATVDAAARDALLAQVEQAIGDDAVHVYLQSLNWLMGVDQERLQNFHYSGVYGAYYDRLWVSA